jgi:hypothetical protein
VFLLQALKDNRDEMDIYRGLWRSGSATVPVEVPVPSGTGTGGNTTTATRQVPWLVEAYMENMASSHMHGGNDDGDGPATTSSTSASVDTTDVTDPAAECQLAGSLRLGEEGKEAKGAEQAPPTPPRPPPAAAAAAALHQLPQSPCALLHCIDNMAHEHTTAHYVLSCAKTLGLRY